MGIKKFTVGDAVLITSKESKNRGCVGYFVRYCDMCEPARCSVLLPGLGIINLSELNIEVEQKQVLPVSIDDCISFLRRELHVGVYGWEKLSLQRLCESEACYVSKDISRLFGKYITDIAKKHYSPVRLTVSWEEAMGIGSFAMSEVCG